MYRISRLFLSVILLTGIVSCSSPEVVEGVSQSLAQYRASTVSDIRYDIEFRLPESLDEPVTGRETISFCLKSRCGLQIDFRADSGAVRSLAVNGKRVLPDVRCEHIVLPASALLKGANAVEIEFVSGNRSLNRNGDFMYSLFVPDRARTVFPCFDQPDLKGRFSLTLDIPSGWDAVANGTLIGSETADGRKRLTFNETQPLPTYLFAFVAGLWQKATGIRNGLPITAYYRENDPSKVAQLDDIFDTVASSLAWLEDYTGISRPFEKYDLVIVPGFQFGGMEHPGAILYNERLMFLGPSPTTSEQLRRTELIAHETSHLWFGDAVTMKWFNDVWTKEVFANYFAAQIAAPIFPDVNNPLREFRGFNIPAYAEDRTLGTNAIRRPLDNLKDAGLIYGNIVYDKAPVVMRLLADMLGSDAFRRGIQEYLGKYLYSNADWNDLISILDKYTDKDLTSWSRVWVEEAGMPEIGCSLSEGCLTVTQKDPMDLGRIWPQNITVFDATGHPVDTVWLDRDASVSNRRKDYPIVLLPNLDALSYGYFRLEGEASGSALESLTSLQAPEARISLLATLYENFLGGTIEPTRFLEALDRLLDTESDPLVAAAAASYLGTLAKHGPLANAAEPEAILLKQARNRDASADIRLTALRSLFGVFRSRETAALLWNSLLKNDGFESLPLGIRDQMTLSYELAVRLPERYGQIRELMASRIENPDTMREFLFIYSAAAPDEAVRDSVFAKLMEPVGRSVEPWAEQALALLNHPLRQGKAVKYIFPALEELQEIQRTEDIFFPKNWCNALLDGHDSPEAAAEVRRFLDSHPDYPPLLKTKLLQSADHLLR